MEEQMEKRLDDTSRMRTTRCGRYGCVGESLCVGVFIQEFCSGDLSHRPPEDRQTRVKTLPSRNSVCGR